MTIEEKFTKKNIELKSKVQTEIQNVQLGLGVKNISQLKTILNEINLMKENPNIHVTYPRIIIDSWDYSDQLGLELIELSDLYKKVYNKGWLYLEMW